MDNEPAKVEQNNITYYPIKKNFGRSFIDKTKSLLTNLETKNKLEIAKFKKVIDDFNPDVIEIFGTELSFGLIYKITDIPTIIHIQGLLHPCFNAYFPPAFNVRDFCKSQKNISLSAKEKHRMKYYYQVAEREIDIISHTKFFRKN